MRLQLTEREVASESDIERVFRTVDRKVVDGVWGFSVVGAKFTSRILQLSTDRRLPSIVNRKEWVEQGGLFSYAADLAAIGRSAAPYVDKIIKGAKPGTLPVQQPTMFELVINLKTATALGLEIPEKLLLRADRVIK